MRGDMRKMRYAPPGGFAPRAGSSRLPTQAPRDPVVTGAQGGAPFVSGLSPQGRLLASTQRRPLVFSTPLVAWQPATGATAYEVQWSKTRYPWRPVGSKVTLATSTLLDLAAGSWYYRVRGLNQAQLRKAEMAWSRPVPVRIARPTFAVAR